MLRIVGGVIGYIALFVLVSVLVVNGMYMLVSPRRWFRLPGWIRMTGTLREDRYASGWGAVEVRLAGAGAFAIGLLFGVVALRWLLSCLYSVAHRYF